MRKMAIFVVLPALAACSAEPVEEPQQSGGAVTANGTVPGTYRVADSGGMVSLVTLNEDGTYSQITPEGTDAANGTFEIVDGKTCFKQHIVGAQALCYTEGERGEDGSYTAVTDDGLELTVEPYVEPVEEGEA